MNNSTFAAAISTRSDSGRAAAEVVQALQAQLGGPPDVAVVFATHHHGPGFGHLLEPLQSALESRHLLGCTAETVLGMGIEAEDQPGLAVWTARLPDNTLISMHLQFERTPEGGTFTGWPDTLPASWPADAALFVLAEPFSFPADALLERLNEGQPGVAVLGGMASGAFEPGANRVFHGNQACNEGAVALYVQGGVKVRAVVSQGCRPIGPSMVITKAERNLIHQLGGRPALERLHEVFAALTPEERELVNRGLHVGRVIDERRSQFGRGDFLVRNCLGVDRDSGSIAIGDWVRPGQTVQFHVRDAQTADDDLREMLAAAGGPAPGAALVFTCNGRGTRLFEHPHHDAAAVTKQFGPIPTAGFFAQGEIGPIGGRSFLHGFTASVALFS